MPTGSVFQENSKEAADRSIPKEIQQQQGLQSLPDEFYATQRHLRLARTRPEYVRQERDNFGAKGDRFGAKTQI